jgi:hypothetical protein
VHWLGWQAVFGFILSKISPAHPKIIQVAS